MLLPSTPETWCKKLVKAGVRHSIPTKEILERSEVLEEYGKKFLSKTANTLTFKPEKIMHRKKDTTADRKTSLSIMQAKVK